MEALKIDERMHWLLRLWTCIEAMQKEGYNLCEAWELYHKAGGNLTLRRFARFWNLAAENPFRWVKG